MNLRIAILQLLPFYKYKIVGKSMYPALKLGQTVLVSKFTYLFSTPQPKDIIVLKDPRSKRLIIKRVSKIKDNKFFVVGDNKDQSTDSRVFGWISKKDIIGKVVHKLKVQS